MIMCERTRQGKVMYIKFGCWRSGTCL